MLLSGMRAGMAAVVDNVRYKVYTLFAALHCMASLGIPLHVTFHPAGQLTPYQSTDPCQVMQSQYPLDTSGMSLFKCLTFSWQVIALRSLADHPAGGRRRRGDGDCGSVTD